MCKITPRDISETIKYVKASLQRRLNQIITDVQNTDHSHYKKYGSCRQQLNQAYLKADAQLHGIKMVLISHRKAVEDLTTARQELHDDWQLHDFQIVALQRPGTKPPYHFEEAKAA